MSSQVSWRASAIGGFGQNTNATSAGAVDTSIPQDLIFYGQLANSSETITLESWRVELYSYAQVMRRATSNKRRASIAAVALAVEQLEDQRGVRRRVD